MKLKKGKKSKKRRGTRLHGFAAKKHKGKGNVGGKGMSGTGKRADQKKTYVIKYFEKYFGKEGAKARKKKFDTINIGDVEKNLSKLIESGEAKKSEKGVEISLPKHKILGGGEIKGKIVIKAHSFSKQAAEKIKKSGGETIILKKEKIIDIKKEKKEEKKHAV